jgi:peroxiredoxin
MKFLIVNLLAILSMCTLNTIAQVKDNNTMTKDSILTNASEMDAFTLMKPGTVVPDFTLTTLEGTKIKLSELKGKTIFLNFFTLSCPMCMKELPLLEKQIWEKYKERSDIVIVAVGREEPIDKLLKFRENKKLSIPIASDPKREVYALFAKQYVPRNIVIDKEGVLVVTEVGFKEEKADNLFRLIENELNK